MNSLETNLRSIKQEKDEKILPENIKKDVQIFDVVGTLESTTEINNQDKEITTNGTYTADEGYTGLGTVTVNVPQTGDVPVKLFKTEEEMQADSEATEGDLAVVYRSEVKNATVDSKFQVATFPDTVVLDNAMTDYIEVRYIAVDSSKMFDCWGELNSSGFMMNCYTESGEIRIEYRSSDGITYTRTRLQGDSGDLENPVDFGTEIYYEMPEMWNDAIGKFIQVGGSTFEGLYQYDSDHISDTNFALLPTNGINIDDKTYIGTPIGNYNKTDIEIIVKKIKSELEIGDINMEVSISTIDGELIITFFLSSAKDICYCNDLCYDKTNKRYQISSFWNYIGDVYVYKLNTENHTYELLQKTSKSSGYFYVDVSGNLDSLFLNASLTTDNTFSTNHKNVTYLRTSENGKNSSNITFSGNDINAELYLLEPKYLTAPTQLTLKNVNELLPGKIAYGKNGVVTGNEAIYDNLNISLTTKHLLPGIPTDSTSDHIITFNNRYVRKNK